MKTCPYCAEQMQDAASFCPHCRKNVNPAVVVGGSLMRAGCALMILIPFGLLMLVLLFSLF